MTGLIFGLLIAGIFSYLALQNSQGVSVNFQNFTATGVPLYIVILGSMLFGIFLSLIISVVEMLVSSFRLFNREQKLKAAEKNMDRLEAKIKELEHENAKIRTSNLRPAAHEEAHEKESVFDRIRHRLST